MKLPKNKYRVIPDCYLGFEVQCKRWWFPFWLQINGGNTSSSLERAKRLIELHKQGAIYYE